MTRHSGRGRLYVCRAQLDRGGGGAGLVAPDFRVGIGAYGHTNPDELPDPDANTDSHTRSHQHANSVANANPHTDADAEPSAHPYSDVDATALDRCGHSGHWTV